MMEKLIITAAICGAEVTKENSPAIPYTVEEMVREAKSAYDAGAAVIHVHVRWDDGTPTQDRERFRVVLEAIKAACPGVILIPSTGGATGMTPEERLQPPSSSPRWPPWTAAPATSATTSSSTICLHAGLWSADDREPHQARV